LTDLKTAERFLTDIERISQPNFIPSDEDITFYHENFNQDCRGVDEMAFEFSDHKYRYVVWVVVVVFVVFLCSFALTFFRAFFSIFFGAI